MCVSFLLSKKEEKEKEKKNAHTPKKNKKKQDSSKERDKLDAMKQVLSLLSGGDDVSFLFADVVKNVVSKNLELKKLVYHFLVHYAESQAELALLSINSFQKDLADANPVIRAAALRVLSSIRLPMIVQIVVLSIQKCIGDSSPYVRKAAAHAITKVYALDPEQKPTLREYIATLLNERSLASLGSAVAAFNDVCPDDWELIHPHYRKLCIMVVDSDEWSQVHMINLLTRYARAHFVNPNTREEEDERLGKRRGGGGWDSDEGEEGGDAAADADKKKKKEETLDDLDLLGRMDSDHRMLLTALAPLLNSSSYQVVMAVVHAFYYIAPAAEAQRSGRALVRILRSPNEVQFVVLCAIVTMAAKRPSMFSQQVSEFFIRGTDPAYLAVLKLEVMTLIANGQNIHTILGEFNYYTTRDNKELVAHAVQAIGRCAARLPKVTDTCMSRLLAFLHNNSPVVVAESVIVIKKVLQLYPKKYSDSVERLARLLDKVADPRARSSIVWVIGEYAEDVPLYAPDVLRKLALSFASEAPEVKVQALNLGMKLRFVNPQQTEAIFRYILELANFDLNYDVRDKARLLNAVIASTGHLGAEAKSLFFAAKPPPKFQDPSEGRQRFVIGSLSHVLNAKLSRHLALPSFPEAMDANATAVRGTDAYSASLLDPRLGGGQQRIPDDWNEDDWGESSSSEGGESEGGYGSDDDDDDAGQGDKWSSSGEEELPIAAPDFDALFRGASAASSPFPAASAAPIPVASVADQVSMLDSIFSGGGGAPSPIVRNDNNRSSSPSPAATTIVALTGLDTPAKRAEVEAFYKQNEGTPISGLDDDLGGKLDNPSVVEENFYGSSPVKRPLVSAETTHGLRIEYAVLSGKANQYGEKYSTVEVYIHNQGESPVQGISVGDTKGFDIHVFPEIPELSAGNSITAEMYVAFPFSAETGASPVSFQMGTDDQQFEVTMQPDDE